jgi:glutamate-1-semialdehyde 2,1-aminomutase
MIRIAAAAQQDGGINREAVLRRAARVLPFQAAAARRGDLRDLIIRAQGAYLWNSDGKRYIDYLLSGGAIVIGHCDPRVNRAVTRAAAACDLNWVGPQPGEVELAEKICEVMPCAERIGFFSSGAEALLRAAQLARAATGRRLLLGFHGGHVGLDADPARGQSASGGISPDPHEPDPAGSSHSEAAEALVIDCSDVEALSSIFADHGPDIAAVLCAPYAHESGCIVPAPDFLQRLRELSSRHGSLLLFDEIKTGFRVHLGGYQAICGVTPDLAAFGNAIGNGWTLAGLAGRAEVMDELGRGRASSRIVAFGSHHPQPYALAAGLATLEILEDGGIHRLNELGDRMRAGIAEVIRHAGVEACVTGLGSEWALHFSSEAPTKPDEVAHDLDDGRATAYGRAMLERGMLEPPLVAGARRLCLATSEDDIERTIEAIAYALRQVAKHT